MVAMQDKISEIKTKTPREFTENSQVLQDMNKRKIIKNLLILCVGVSFHSGPYNALESLQSTMNHAKNAGVDSLSIMLGTKFLFCLLLPKLLIKRFGCKITLVVSVLMYLPYIASNFNPTRTTMLLTAIPLGIGSSLLWVSAETCINELSFMNAKGDTSKATFSTSKYFGIFRMFFQLSLLVANLVSFYVLRSPDINSTINQNISQKGNLNIHFGNTSCGSEFCGSKTLISIISLGSRSMLVGIFFISSLIAAIILLFLDSLKVEAKEDDFTSIFLKFSATFKFMKRTAQQLLIVLTIFIGLEESFLYADYNQAYIACALGSENIGLVYVCYGIINSITAFTNGRLIKYVPRVALVIAAASSNFGVCITLLWWKPSFQKIWIFYVLIGFWGFSDGIWQTQIKALYGVLFHSDEEAAFGNYYVWKTLGWFIVFICSGHLCTAPKIFILMVFLTVGVTGYIALEIKNFRNK